MGRNTLSQPGKEVISQHGWSFRNSAKNMILSKNVFHRIKKNQMKRCETTNPKVSEPWIHALKVHILCFQMNIF